MSDIYFKCKCGKHIATDKEGAGIEIDCPDCGLSITIPRANVEWACACGNTMFAPSCMMGQNVQCLHCKNFSSIPLKDNKCPSCGRSMKEGFVVCQDCGFNTKTGEQVILCGQFDKKAFLRKVLIVTSVLIVLGISVFVCNVTMAKVTKQRYETGLKYLHGNGVQKDEHKAMELFRKAAERGHDESLYALGQCYYFGHGTPTNKARATIWFEKAAERGHVEAQNIIGVCYKNGDGMPSDMNKAVNWFEKAATQGHMDAQNSLALCYMQGVGVPEDMDKAVNWFEKAAAQGHASAQNDLALCYMQGVGVPEDMDKAVNWFEKAAAQGHMDAQNSLALCYMQGLGVSEDVGKALEWFEKAALQGCPDAQNNLALCYMQGLGVSEDMDKAIKWFEKAAAQGHMEARKRLDDASDRQQYKFALLQGDFDKANTIAFRIGLESSIPHENVRYLYFLTLCEECRNGKCMSCNGSGTCGSCESGICPMCKGKPQTQSRCNACVCVQCAGSGVCQGCRGDKRVYCSTCKGTGWGSGHETVNCRRCNGKGYSVGQLINEKIPCQLCHGKGKVTGARNKCKSCNGKAIITCEQCKGTGRCTHCSGRGASEKCAICDGKRVLLSVCEMCKGNGKCLECSGNGLCQSCNGNKICDTCKGCSVLLKHTAVVNKSWFVKADGIYSATDRLSESIHDQNVMLGNRPVIIPDELTNGVAIITEPSRFSDAVNLIMGEK